ncbi:MAG: helix-turn-helix domain-containing protein [Candidatus Aenigmarchaeota archaeon]|nr:helix-turn-helix domain-containing protein [Candidatus Aenigmarchaeota archaeon]
MPFLVEEDDKKQKAYESLLISDPKLLSYLSSELALRVIKVLSKQPSCAMDVARKLKEHEQKIYYHLRNLERVGLVKLLKTEERVGAIAKIYAVNYPVVSFKLFDGKEIIDKKTKAKELKFLGPFIKDGKLDATIIIGSPDPHGKYGAQASDGCCAIDLALFLGSLVKESILPNYKLDTEIKEKDLKNNLILVGGPKTNIVVDKVNKRLPIYFDFYREWNIVSPFSKNVYTGDEIGVVEKIKNPFDQNKQVLVFAGKRFKGTRAAILSLVKNLGEIEKGNKFDSSIIAKVVQGIDKDSDGRIDEAEFLE